MELDTSIMQTKTVGNIVKVLEKIEDALQITALKSPKAYEIRTEISQIIDKREIAMTLIKSYKE